MRVVFRGEGRMRIVTNAQDDGRARMTKLAKNALRFALAVAAGTVCLFVNDNVSTAQRSSLITQEDARMSVAGERRRHARRAVRRSYAARYGADSAYSGYLGYSSAYAASPRGYPRTYYGTLAPSPYFGFSPTYPGWSYEGSYPLGYYGGYPSYYER